MNKVSRNTTINMAMKTTVLFGTPQKEIATLIKARMANALNTDIVTGFATKAGIKLLEGPIAKRPDSLRTFILGAGTFKAFEALGELQRLKVGRDRLFVHLGHTKLKQRGQPSTFVRHHPMLHSKIYYCEFDGDTACAFIGSNNVTSFALKGNNGEASVLLEGPKDSLEFESIREHISAAKNQSMPYDPDLNSGFAWWTQQFLDAFGRDELEVGDETTKRTILIFAESKMGLPVEGQYVYFELPAGIQFKQMNTMAYLYIFDVLPPSPQIAIDNAKMARAKFNCSVTVLGNREGITGIEAQWQISGDRSPVLMPVAGNIVNPLRDRGKQQVRVIVNSKRVRMWNPKFGRTVPNWIPEFAVNISPTTQRAELHEEGHSVPEDQSWQLVKKLKRAEDKEARDNDALVQVSPESGNFILVSTHRGKLQRKRKGLD